MAPVIWGLDLAEFKWSKFGSKNMWNNVYHLRRTKFIIYQCALIFCVVSESLGTAALSDYVDQQKFLKAHDHAALEYNNDYIAVASYNIWSGIFVATIFGAAFFFDLIWPERYESPSVRLAWKICSVIACVFYIADAFALTIITARHSAYVNGVDAATAQGLLAHFKKFSESPLAYRENKRAIASVVFVWLGLVSVIASAILLIVDKNHAEKFGPFSTHVRQEMEKDPEANLNPLTEKSAHRAPAEQTSVPHDPAAETAATRAAAEPAVEPEVGHNTQGARPGNDNTVV
ncbi:hypothetical protein MBLNU459_g0592t1 [Dothideomycetes sp. NU459]